MDRTVKVFCAGAEQDRLAERHRVIERYDGFVLAEVSKKGVAQLSRRYPVEDITDLYTIRVGERTIDTSKPRLDASGKVRSHPVYQGVKLLPPGRHHHLVQFIGPIKGEWLRAVKRAGGEPARLLRTSPTWFAQMTRRSGGLLRSHLSGGLATYPIGIAWRPRCS